MEVFSPLIQKFKILLHALSRRPGQRTPSERGWRKLHGCLMTSRITVVSHPARVGPRVQESNAHPFSVVEDGILTWSVSWCQWFWVAHTVIPRRSTSGCTCGHGYYSYQLELSWPLRAESFTPLGRRINQDTLSLHPNFPPFTKPALKEVRCIQHPLSHH